ncbi:hypothetical protein AVEN_184836-1, partial [Araneus ventricosus]
MPFESRVKNFRQVQRATQNKGKGKDFTSQKNARSRNKPQKENQKEAPK